MDNDYQDVLDLAPRRLLSLDTDFRTPAAIEDEESEDEAFYRQVMELRRVYDDSAY